VIPGELATSSVVFNPHFAPYCGAADPLLENQMMVVEAILRIMNDSEGEKKIYYMKEKAKQKFLSRLVGIGTCGSRDNLMKGQKADMNQSKSQFMFRRSSFPQLHPLAWPFLILYFSSASVAETHILFPFSNAGELPCYARLKYIEESWSSKATNERKQVVGELATRCRASVVVARGRRELRGSLLRKGCSDCSHVRS